MNKFICLWSLCFKKQTACSSSLSLPPGTSCSVLPLIVFFFYSHPLWPPPPGGLRRGRGLDPLPESRGLAPLQEHLPGLVRHGARGGPVQRRHHGPVRLRHPALRLRVSRGGAAERGNVGIWWKTTDGGVSVESRKWRRGSEEGLHVDPGCAVDEWRVWFPCCLALLSFQSVYMCLFRGVQRPVPLFLNLL